MFFFKKKTYFLILRNAPSNTNLDEDISKVYEENRQLHRILKLQSILKQFFSPIIDTCINFSYFGSNNFNLKIKNFTKFSYDSIKFITFFFNIFKFVEQHELLVCKQSSQLKVLISINS